jgi:hypothetical protein
LRLKLLHALLQAINPDLALGTLPRQRIAPPLLRELLALQRDLLALRDPLFARAARSAPAAANARSRRVVCLGAAIRRCAESGAMRWQEAVTP